MVENIKEIIRVLLALIVLIFLIGCRVAEGPSETGSTTQAQLASAMAIQPDPTQTPTLTPSLSPTPTSTPTPTATPTPTFTPTPTAPPVIVSGNLRAALLATPGPQSGAPCGVVDLLDFPLNPPDADNVSGGRDFGVFRRRYDKYHAGEDWWMRRGRSNFGLPVYSIGHGQVTYAEPLGWGRDKGVVIVRHTFSDGRSILSFYGHLDPPSVVLGPGDCVARGDQVGKIGRPSTPPHLHFEIRSHMPTQPGGGYWPEDPTLAGWEAPSRYIWNQRIASSPGVRWVRSQPDDGARGVGNLTDELFIAIQEDQLVAISLVDGSVRWRHPGTDGVADAMLDIDRRLVYIANRRGRIEAYRLPDQQEAGAQTAPEADPLWTRQLDAAGWPTLMPLPRGGVALSLGRRVFAMSAEGLLLWQETSINRPLAWALADDVLVLSLAGRDTSLWSLDESGIVAWELTPGGLPVVAGEELLLYGEDGIYRLDTATRSADLLFELPRNFLGLGDAVALPGGGLLVAHRDRADQRLIALDSSGQVRWERSYRSLPRGQPALLAVDGRVLLLLQSNQTSSSEVSLFSVNTDQPELTRIFSGGSRSSSADQAWVMEAGQQLVLIQIGDENLAALDVQLVAEAHSSATGSP